MASQTGSKMARGLTVIEVYPDLQSQTQAFQLVQQWRNGSGSRLRNRASTHRFDQSDRGCARTIKDNMGFSTLRNTRGILADGWVGRTVQRSLPAQVVGWNGERERALMAHLGCFICMHQGGHLSPLELHAFHQHASPLHAFPLPGT
jgi:uncharacterized protein YfaT (DUF1175 family)